jgi:hypothetical protein
LAKIGTATLAARFLRVGDHPAGALSQESKRFHLHRYTRIAAVVFVIG